MTTDFHQPKPVEKCPCGADCAWCVGSNKARLAFPRAKVPPEHDAAKADEHHCAACFVKLPGAVVTECKAEDMEPWTLAVQDEGSVGLKRPGSSEG